MTARIHDWTATRKAWTRPCIVVLLALASVQAALSLGHPAPRLVGGLAYILLCLAAIWVMLARAQLVRNRAPLLSKILAWAVPAASGFAMVGHLLFGRPVEQALLGGGCALIAVMSLFIAFSPDDADMVDNEQITKPSKP
jgi:hypothetical protein